MHDPTHLDLFSGIGGFALAARRADFRTVGFSEIEPYACKILKRHWPDVPNHGDIRNIRGVQADLVTGGFPCQPFSVAGKRKGASDDRALWPEMRRVIAESGADWVLAENVPGIIGMELDNVLSDLEALGYTTGTLVIPACAVDARHRRDRVWIVAHADQELRRQGRNGREQAIGQRPMHEPSRPSSGTEPLAHSAQQHGAIEGRQTPELGRSREALADAGSSGQPRPGAFGHASDPEASGKGQATEPWNGGVGSVWSPEPEFLRMAHGLSEGLDALDERLISHYSMGNGKTPKTRPEEEMQAMRRAADAEKIWQPIGGQIGFPPTAVLRSKLYGGVSTEHIPIQSFLETLSQTELRNLWERAIASSASSRQRQKQQRSRQSQNDVRKVPRELALAKWQAANGLVLRLRQACNSMGVVLNSPDEIEEIWKSLSDPQKVWIVLATVLGINHAEWPDVPRVVTGIPNRTHRLRGLGNAIVPQVAEEILREIRQHFDPGIIRQRCGG